ncbi:exopolyphosphatase/guanosine-5'-triphosphate,3'-diphosphate pyrophosphatase [Methanomicrobium sp. W14]|uniref:Ppx/GppA phosphatase family protein n=1 Tax=Methanomicrobium sp. W14 TaxID=2817839 RepID=UPI001AE65571|nr:Ppx/GppA phosphatase family protein [Methanomicrobium sp. W14]MBP2132740.1 exopolyphosphatase/guanosine-5'-triphosphate,3'-diphosphate pyrophosphatase [Methanomicrobium sp. W14]
MAEGLKEKVVAFIDLGTNSARLLVVRLNPNYSYSILRRQKETVRLGQGEFSHRYLDNSAIERAVLVCRQFCETSKSFGADEIISVATSATREALNKDLLLQKIKTGAGLPIEVISGTEEARLIYLGVSSGVHIGNGKYFFIDIGGGSTEIIIGDQFNYYLLESLKLGAIRTTNKFFTENYQGTVSAARYEQIKRHILSKIVYVSKNIKKFELSGAIGSSGTIQALADIKNHVIQSKNSSGSDYLTLDELHYLIEYLCKKNLDERKNIPGINPERADIIVAGAIILYTILNEAGIKEIKISDRSLRDGMLFDYLSKLPGFPHAEQMPVRERSVQQLGKSCRIDETHAKNVIRLSLGLFDSGKETGFHSFGDKEKEILRYAAYLHDIGQFISFSQHQNHSYYVITNAPLLGFNENEVEIIGLITKYHRKKMPKKDSPVFSRLNEHDQNAVIILSLFLRMAEHMERSHDGRVEKAYFSDLGDDYSLNLESKSECNIERWSLEEDAKIFKRVFGKKLNLNFICPD